jgi:hypothetical protein
MQDPFGSGASGEARTCPEDGAYLNTQLRVADLGKILGMSGRLGRPPTLESVVLPNFQDGETVPAPSNPLHDVLSEFQEISPLALLATFAGLGQSTASIDSIFAFGTGRGVPVIVLSYAPKMEWEDACQLHESNRMVRFCAPQPALAEQLHVNSWPNHAWDPRASPSVRNGLFLIERDAVRDKYRFAGSWIGPEPYTPHDVITIDRFLTTVRTLSERVGT